MNSPHEIKSWIGAGIFDLQGGSEETVLQGRGIELRYRIGFWIRLPGQLIPLSANKKADLSRFIYRGAGRGSDRERFSGCRQKGVRGKGVKFENQAVVGKNAQFRCREIDGEDSVGAGRFRRQASGSGGAVMPIRNVGASDPVKELYDFRRIRAAPDGVDDPAFIGHFGEGFLSGLDFIHPGGELGKVWVGGEDRSGQSTKMSDQMDPIILLVRPGELMFSNLTGGIVAKISQSRETSLPVFCVDHADEIDGGG